MVSASTNAQEPKGTVIAVIKEQAGEKRVATVPEVVRKLAKAGHEVRVERDAGAGAFYPDNLYEAAGAKIEVGILVCIVLPVDQPLF